MSEQSEPKPARLASLDALRGLIIVLMALDHANHFVAQKHSSGEYWGGTFPAYQDALPFLTRAVTHLAAPGFFFLMGTGMVLFARARQKQGWSKPAVIKHFLIRGLVLIGVQLLLVNRAWELSPGGWALETYIGVLFALGGTMMIGSLLLWIRPRYLLAVTAVLLIGTELLTPDPGQWNQAFSMLNRLLLTPGGDGQLWVNYPIFPWLELVTLGIVFGHWLRNDARQAMTRAWQLGLVFLLAFVGLRFLGGFGNLRPQTGTTWIDFFNVVKYPPSLTFTLLTTGINLTLLGLAARVSQSWHWLFQPFTVFGRVPLFFYIAHLFLYAALGHWLTPDGTSISTMYLYWLLGLLILYPLCVWYGQLKHKQSAKSLLRFV